MKKYTQKELEHSFKKIGLCKGDVVYVHSRLFTLGMMENVKSKEELCGRVLESIFEVITDSGTIVVPAFTTQTARYGVPFILEETKCMTGMFSEYVRCHKDSIRSLHPVLSVAAIGKYKNEICVNASSSNWGLDSPYDRMFKMGSKTLNLGLVPFHNTFFHYIETLYNLPYLYNKLLNIDVYQNGCKVDKLFFLSIHYLDFNVIYDLDSLNALEEKEKLVENIRVGSSVISCAENNNYCYYVLKALKDNPYFLLKKPPFFRPGVVPFDGITNGKDEKSKTRAYAFLTTKNSK